MKKVLLFLFVAVFATSCAQQSVEITVSNNSDLARTNEIVEIDAKDVLLSLCGDTKECLSKKSCALIDVCDAAGNRIEYQLTYDNKLIFPVTIAANASETYSVSVSTDKMEIAPKVYGRFVPERIDDFAWENDKIAFRTYGPALQASGEKAYGYDIWVKRTSDLVIDKRYAGENSPEALATKKALKEAGKTKELKAFVEANSYHRDHGNGLDYYNVGPTLGAGMNAFMDGEKIIYQHNYATQEVLDNGPLRFSVKLGFEPMVVNGEEVVESRVISLDAGSQLNKTTVSYNKLSNPLPAVVGIILHDGSEDYSLSGNAMTYADAPVAEHGQTFIATVFPENVKTSILKFEGEELAYKNKKGGANGHLLATFDLNQERNFTYYWGAGWTKWGFENLAAWNAYVADFTAKMKTPLRVSVK